MKRNFTQIKGLLKRAALAFSILTVSTTLFAAEITITDADLGSGTYDWTNDNTYLLDGFVFLEDGGVLNIQEGTIIKGIALPSTGDNASALIITVGAMINAIGTADQPIIFTSEIDDTSDSSDLLATDRGLWGGLIMLGDGILGNSSVTSNIEGIPTTEERAVFGGTDNTNNAGTLKYVSIRHGGAELSPGDEINGLTLGGIGSGTTIEHIEIFSNLDDGMEFFGGAVNVKYATIAFCGDDGFDWDLGWVGNGQFWFVLQGVDAADNGGEWDGAKPDANDIYSNPTVYNATFIGSGTSGATASNTNAILMRDATAGTVANSIFTEYANKALEIEDLPAASGMDSYTRMENGEINLLNNIWYGFNTFTTMDANETTGIIRPTADGDDPSCAALISHLNSNNNNMDNPMINSISRFPNAQLDPRPDMSGAASSDLATIPADAFFTDVDYKGAFNFDGYGIWLTGWSALDEYGYIPTITSVEDFAIESEIQISVYPNPVNESMTIEFDLAQAETVSFSILDIFGKVVSQFQAEGAITGVNKTVWDASSLSTGTYLVQAKSKTTIFTTKFIVQ